MFPSVGEEGLSSLIPPMLDRQTERQTEKQRERQKDFSAYSSKQKLFRMSTGCQKDRKTERQKYRQTDRQTD